MSPSAELVVVAGADEGMQFLVGDEIAVFGRSKESAAVVFSDTGISRKHGHFVCREDQLFFKDYGSVGGTYCDGELVGWLQEVSLVVGQKLILGQGTIIEVVRIDIDGAD